MRWFRIALIGLTGTGLLPALADRTKAIAATALANDLAVATRNRSDFAKAGVRIVDPFNR